MFSESFLSIWRRSISIWIRKISFLWYLSGFLKWDCLLFGDTSPSQVFHDVVSLKFHQHQLFYCNEMVSVEEIHVTGWTDGEPRPVFLDSQQIFFLNHFILQRLSSQELCKWFDRKFRKQHIFCLILSIIATFLNELKWNGNHQCVQMKRNHPRFWRKFSTHLKNNHIRCLKIYMTM